MLKGMENLAIQNNLKSDRNTTNKFKEAPQKYL